MDKQSDSDEDWAWPQTDEESEGAGGSGSMSRGSEASASEVGQQAEEDGVSRAEASGDDGEVIAVEVAPELLSGQVGSAARAACLGQAVMSPPCAVGLAVCRAGFAGWWAWQAGCSLMSGAWHKFM